ncbi:SUKH-4 family immunity protein [Streptomyces sp. NPDC096311]|uniref:SUKH-4 family immunity protein n=1 Tax=Streptomyces sp. NPDC096311 TaxID=3366083 RepID=UPI00382AEA95
MTGSALSTWPRCRPGTRCNWHLLRGIGGIGERGLVAIATSGLFGRIAVYVASGHVVQIPNIASSTTHHVNRDLDSFSRCVAAVIARFPFCAEDDEERFEEVAEELRELISGIDGTALADNGFWETFCDGVAIGDYVDWDG